MRCHNLKRATRYIRSVRSETPMDIFSPNITRHSRFDTTLENAISNIFLPALTDHECTQLERDILVLPVRNGGLGIPNPCHEAMKEYAASIQVTGPLVRQIESQMHELPDQSNVQTLKRKARQEKNEIAKEKADLIINSVSPKSKHMLDLPQKKELLLGYKFCQF